ncbi:MULTISPECIES: hypothetical protein [unclassified Janthinobacterium]|uniref:hypothetical protein n=1 Tax=unclassified Janthinobacterium TaxID=2610881 RepID=UPI0012F8F058|nr:MULTISPECIES: hypothetical protein [unclassified Janthinobacterium]MEC5161896.1 hypothetical protein [Janthinobacterium sp. CG_S6]
MSYIDRVNNGTIVNVIGESFSDVLVDGRQTFGNVSGDQTGAGAWGGDIHEIRYNAYNEVVGKGVNGSTAEFAEYDKMGGGSGKPIRATVRPRPICTTRAATSPC